MHGSGLSHIVWSLHEQFYITNGFNVLSVDLPGHGNSEGPCLESIEEMSLWLNEFVEHLGIEKSVLVGHSQGCLVGLEFARRYPNKIDKIVFMPLR